MTNFKTKDITSFLQQEEEKILQRVSRKYPTPSIWRLHLHRASKMENFIYGRIFGKTEGPLPKVPLRILLSLQDLLNEKGDFLKRLSRADSLLLGMIVSNLNEEVTTLC